MNRIKLAFLLATTLATPAAAKLRVVATTTDLGFIAAEVGGDRVDVTTLSRGYQDPHFLEPKPSYIVQISRADALLFVGLDLEVGWLPKLLDGAHNPNIQEGRRGLFSPSSFVSVLEKPSGAVSRAEGDVHPDGNPHYWLSPANFAAMVSAIAQRLGELDPEGSTGFAARAASLRARVDKKHGEWKRRLEPARGMKVVTYHKTLNYFLDAFGLVGIDYIEPRPGVPPSSRHLSDLIAAIKTESVKLLLVENFFEPRNGSFVAERAGVPMAVVPVSVGGEKEVTTWFDLMEKLVAAVEAAAKR